MEVVSKLTFFWTEGSGPSWAVSGPEKEKEQGSDGVAEEALGRKAYKALQAVLHL